MKSSPSCAARRRLKVNPGAFAHPLWEEAMCSDISQSMPPNSVLVYENMGEWFVVLVRDGRENVSSFELESFATAFAHGQ